MSNEPPLTRSEARGVRYARELEGHLGWLDTFPALIVPRLVSAFGVFLMRQYYLSLPKELEEAALVDGASRWRIFWRIGGCSSKWACLAGYR